VRCDFCGYEFDEACGRYGCPNCLGEGLDEPMIYGSVCSGIEAATVAWSSLGWQPAFFAENDPAPSRLLALRFPDVPNLGDINDFKNWPDANLDVLVGGTPCQSFSVAGLRRGLADPRGNLALVYLAIAERYRPDWLVWENVPGVLSAAGGRDFGSFIGALVQLGYCPAWRVFDAQYFGVPQRRKRVFVVANSHDWRRAASVLFEPESLRRNPPPSRETGQAVAGPLGGCAQSGGFRTTDLDNSGAFIPEVANPLTARMHKGINTTADEGQTAIVEQEPYSLMPMNSSKDYKARPTDVAQPVMAGRPSPEARQGGDMVITAEVADPLTAGSHKPGTSPPGRRQEDDYNIVAEAFKASHYTRGKDGAPASIAPPLSADADRGDQDTLVFDPTQVTNPDNRSNPQPGDPAHPLTAEGKPPLMVNLRGREGGNLPETDDTGASPALRTGGGGSGNPLVLETRIRRLTPLECERLQGFPDDWTKLEKMSDTARYKMLGNSMAVPVMTWIGERIDAFQKTTSGA